ncbi:uncharacterized protein BDR25DRAFT_336980 [Lindgomyces ingoldianus]|uniref:Uncharacterized protein n=1 Tax=Lindgomyces ingoldianus TaxID=673940 RepID=A0ACB6QF86_9PLEO|nr:uncharacterized protein BDR25DRAFT_336980 [Lindgomyces ingoldianus]KAF2465586.1 hypothetical protein BDR25DRAFT_336980 [Lindgomyces ingoldianus]
MGYVDHAVRRSLEHPRAMNFIRRAVEKAPEVEIPKWGVAVLAITLIVLILGVSAIEYTLKDVIATLAMVETPSAAITVSPSSESPPKDVKEDLLETGPTITLVHTKPITSSIRGTIRHLISQAGRFSRWRGIKSFLLYNLCFSIVGNLIESILPRVPGRLILASGLAGALCANLHAAWTHKVISMPSDTKFLRRIPARSNWKLLALPAAINASAGYLSFYVAHGSSMLLGLHRIHNQNPAAFSGAEWVSVVFRVLAVIIIVISCCLFIVLPAHVTQIRVEASILPEDQDTIIPFDRTLGGKVVPKILGGTGCVGFLDAWRSFNWEARRRLIKLYTKIVLIITALVFVVAHIMAFETWAIMGPALGKFLAQARQQGYIA